MKVIVEIFGWDGDSDEQPKVLHTLRHTCHSVEFVKAAANRVIESMELQRMGTALSLILALSLRTGEWQAIANSNSVAEE
jgi:hypothetical protein